MKRNAPMWIFLVILKMNYTETPKEHACNTYSDEGLVEAVEAQVPDEPAADERRNEPEVEVGDHQERSATHHPAGHRHKLVELVKKQQQLLYIFFSCPTFFSPLKNDNYLNNLYASVLHESSRCQHFNPSENAWQWLCYVIFKAALKSGHISGRLQWD